MTQPKKRVVFIGSSRWGLKALEVLTELDSIDVVGALTNPSVFKISYRPEGVKNVHHADVASFCSMMNIPTYVMASDETMKSEAMFEALSNFKPDYFFALGWYHVIPKKIRDLAPVLGIHYSLLPDYAGGAPLVWALINQESTVGATFFQLDGGIDTGPIIGQASVNVQPRETIAQLYDRVGWASLELLRLAQLYDRVGWASLELLKREFPRFARDEIKATDQTFEGRRVFAQRGPEDGQLDWNQSNLRIDAFIRAQTRPYPGAFWTYKNRQIHVWDAPPSDLDFATPPGTVHVLENQVFVQCKPGSVELQSISIDGLEHSGQATFKAIAHLVRNE